MAAFNRAGVSRRWTIRLSLVAVVAAISVGAVLWQVIEVRSVAAVSERIDAAQALLGCVRLGIIAGLAVSWPWLVELIGRWRGSEAWRSWIPLRWRVVGWLLALELVIGQDLTGRLVELVGAIG